MLADGRTVVSGGDSGYVILHQVGEPGLITTPPVCLAGHRSAVMCLGATASGDVLSGSVTLTLTLALTLSLTSSRAR